MDLADLHQRAGEEFSRLVDEIKPDQWIRPTPDPDWDVKALVNHLTTEQLWVPPLVEGQTIAQVGDRFSGDVLGGDPKLSWRRAIEASVKAFHQPGAMDRTVHLSFGDRTGREYAKQMFIDLVIHSWDLAKGIGVHDKLEPELVKDCYELLLPQAEEWRSGGAFGTQIDVPESADLQTKLLALSGRRV
jgi:uncharacterized protein (TIGR03086 family)